MGRKWVWAICVVLLLCWQQAAPVPVPATAHRAPTPAMSAVTVAKYPPNERAATDYRRQILGAAVPAAHSTAGPHLLVAAGTLAPTAKWGADCPVKYVFSLS